MLASPLTSHLSSLTSHLSPLISWLLVIKIGTAVGGPDFFDLFFLSEGEVDADVDLGVGIEGETLLG